MTDILKDQMTEAHTLDEMNTSVKQKAEMLMHPDSEIPVLVHEAFVQTEDMVQGTPVLV